MSSVTITLCMIVKNEEKNLTRCLQSARELVDQIVVVDTGSTDRTVEIARRFGAEVYHFRWCDDFAAARNEALKYARGDWVLQLDADHELQWTPDFNLKETLQNSDFLGFVFSEKSLIQGREVASLNRLLLFKNIPGLEYRGKIHESPYQFLREFANQQGIPRPVGRLDSLWVKHTGYQETEQKLKRNLAILEKAVEEEPANSHYQYKLLLTLHHAHLDELLDWYRRWFFLIFNWKNPLSQLSVSQIGLIGLFAEWIFAQETVGEGQKQFLNYLLRLGNRISWADSRLALPVAKVLLRTGQVEDAILILEECILGGVAPDTAPLSNEERIRPYLLLLKLYYQNNLKTRLVELLTRMLEMLKKNQPMFVRIFEHLAEEDKDTFEFVYKLMQTIIQVQAA